MAFGGGDALRIFLVFCVVLCAFSSSYVLLAQCCQCLWIVHSWLLIPFSLMFIFLAIWGDFLVAKRSLFVWAGRIVEVQTITGKRF